MRRLFLLLMLFAVLIPLHALDKSKYKMVQRYNTLTKTWMSFPEVTINDIQICNLDSLKKLDTLQNTDNTKWTYQASSMVGDTVVITALVISPVAAFDPWFGLTFTQHGWTMVLHDTAANSNEWGGILVRVGSGFLGGGPDTAQARLDGMLNAERGDIIKMTGWVEEFPTANAERVNSTTQFRPYPGIAITIEGSGTIPAPTMLSVSDFYEGGYPGGKVKYSTGEAYEGSLVELHNLTVNVLVNEARGTWAMTDPFGNYMADYDGSHFYTFGHYGATDPPPIPGDPSFTYPPIGAVIDTIRGTMLTVAGGENPRGYRITPLYSAAALPGYTGDVIYGVSLPSVTTHRRYPVVVDSFDSVAIQARIAKVAGGYDIASAHLFVSLNNGPWEDRPMTMISPDSTYQAYIIDIDGNPWPANTAVRYFIKGIDINGYSQILANSSFTFANDTSKGFFFYTVLDRPLTIRDIQYTPYPNGRTGYLGGDVSISGIVTADTSDLGITALNTGGTSSWYIQDGTTPWSGIWVVSSDSASSAALKAMQRGDSVTVTGSVQENFDVTRIFDSLVTIHSSGHTLPEPITITSGTFGPGVGSGTPSAEQYEGMLVRVVGATVSDVYPTFTDATEFSINDGSSPVIIRRDGLNSYSNQEGDTSSGKTHILHVPDRMDTLVGIAYFSFSRYKIDPRNDDDFVAGDPYQYSNGWNMLSVGRNQLPPSTGYEKTTLFPTAVSPAYYYDASYQIATTLLHTRGHWLKFNGGQTIRQLGTKRTLDTVQVKAGWNLVGTLGNPVATNTFVAEPGGNSLSAFFGYNGAYVLEDTLEPTKGYWVNAAIDGYFVQSAPMMLPKMTPPAVPISEFNTLTISDREGHSQILYFGQDTEGKMLMRNYQMPPASPEAGTFDVRYASGRILEAYPTDVSKGSPDGRAGMEFGIVINAKNAPLTLSWNIVNPQGKKFTIAGKAIKTKEIAGTGEVLIPASGNVQLNLTVNGGAVPKEFALSQNYPNPFNPSTKFEVALPLAAHLDVAVYNLLGQKVATLANEDRDAGYHILTWNGTTQSGVQVASGIYFVRMNARQVGSSDNAFNTVRKMMLMK